MSGSLNKVLIIGNLGKDPEVKATATGQTAARFSVATTENWKNPQGEKQSKTEWHNIVVWGKQAEIAEKYLRKGNQVMIEGRLQYRDYIDQAGVKKFFTEIRCDNFVMLGRLGDGNPLTDTPPPEIKAPPPVTTAFDDDIPF
jgi:single-strand DNA-binding protein